ncbi:MAG: bifunctional UDP-N-acetylglucosamine diphosphorylase/glucosamine-1-phosphate N-acetyltransferase GlmU [Ruminococcaceae bacterium]|nr:bifunctional UDP-N-acetylglucosamine diphosphorylase/glucosamine-1-phosphate N-acetyltransferase GlmU [Oscillospiraceae bacterium]
MTTGCIILAGGAGKRMKSERPKVLCEVLKKPMLGWVMDTAEKFGFDETAVITGYKKELTEEYVNKRGKIIYTYFQPEQKGTGDAVKQAQEFIEAAEYICVLNGDAPFIDEETLEKSLAMHKEQKAAVTVITAEIADPTGYGRIIRDENGRFTAIREQKDCSPEEAEICEVNSGAYWFNSDALLRALPRLTDENASGEFYLTDCVEIIGGAQAYKSANPDIVLGANTRQSLMELNEKARIRVINRLLDEGVSFISTDGIIIGADVKIGCDTTVLPNTMILGKTVIGKNCTIGANSHIEDCTVGDNVILNNVQAYSTTVEDNVRIGPFAQLRPGTIIRRGVKIGDFVEVKNSDIGENTAISHLTYVGDSDVGRGVNFGCGCVTANYDGVNKFRTEIGANAFIGCNTNLIAPVKIGENATTAAGSTITSEVPPNSLALERSQTKIIENWEKNFKRKRK